LGREPTEMQKQPLSASDFARFSSDEEDDADNRMGHGPNIDDSEIVVWRDCCIAACSHLNFFFLSFPSAQLSENGIIGQGNFGVVHKGMCRGAQVAVKIPKVEDLSAEKLEEFRAELK
jgi:hypothetical protein